MPPQRSGCSRAATRPSAQTIAWVSSRTVSSPPVETAPEVRHHRRPVTFASPRAWISAMVTGSADENAVPVPAVVSWPRARARVETIPVTGRSPAVSVRSAASPSRSAVSAGTVRRRTVAPRSSRARPRSSAQLVVPSVSVGVMRSQVPVSSGAVVSGSGVQATR